MQKTAGKKAAVKTAAAPAPVPNKRASGKKQLPAARPGTTRTGGKAKTTEHAAKPKITRSLHTPVTVQPPPPVVEEPAPARKPPGAHVVRAFEHAVRVLNRRDFATAKSLLETLLSRYPQEVEVAARAHIFLQICNQKLARKPAVPPSADELYDRGVFA
ncbi:MAG: hypothetical protein ACKV2V_09370, partial [Blastocatellia bacterium]